MAYSQVHKEIAVWTACSVHPTLSQVCTFAGLYVCWTRGSNQLL